MIDYRLVRSRRRTVAIHITPAGEVEVRAPLRLSRAVIEGFVAEKRDWIQDKTAEAARRAASRTAFAREGPQTLPLLGREYPVERGHVAEASFDGARFLVPGGPAERLPAALEPLYRRLAEELLPPRVAVWAARMDLAPTAVRVTGAVTRWGSCSGKNSLNFSWRLALAPSEAVDYVAVHELAHMREHNHSARFWAEVETILPDFEARRALLRRVQERLSLEGWDRTR